MNNEIRWSILINFSFILRNILIFLRNILKKVYSVNEFTNEIESKMKKQSK